MFGGKVTSSNRHGAVFVSTFETTVMAKSNSELNGAALSDSQLKGSTKRSPVIPIFPKGLETLLAEVCDESKIAELKVKDIYQTLSFSEKTLDSICILSACGTLSGAEIPLSGSRGSTVKHEACISIIFKQFFLNTVIRYLIK